MNIDLNNIDDSLLFEDERITSYLKGKMAPDDERAFLKELESNLELKNKTIAIARMIKGMKEVGTANDEEIIDEFLAADSKEIRIMSKKATSTNKGVSTAKRLSIGKVTKWMSVAASLLLIIWGGIGYNDYRKTTGLGEEYANVFISSQITRGSENSEVEMKLAKFFDNVQNKYNLDNTLKELTICWLLSTQATYNDYTDYAPEIGWNLAIGHLKNNDKKSAKVVLIKLTQIAPSGTAAGDKARELLEKVEKL